MVKQRSVTELTRQRQCMWRQGYRRFKKCAMPQFKGNQRKHFFGKLARLLVLRNKTLDLTPLEISPLKRSPIEQDLPHPFPQFGSQPVGIRNGKASLLSRQNRLRNSTAKNPFQDVLH